MKKIFLNEDWQFARLPDGVFPVASESDWKTVTLPHTWYSDGDQYRGLAVYCKTVAVDPAWQRLYLEFDGADQVCHVFINGEFIGEHRGGYARFRFPVPEKAPCPYRQARCCHCLYTVWTRRQDCCRMYCACRGNNQADGIRTRALEWTKGRWPLSAASSFNG